LEKKVIEIQPTDYPPSALVPSITFLGCERHELQVLHGVPQKGPPLRGRHGQTLMGHGQSLEGTGKHGDHGDL